MKTMSRPALAMTPAPTTTDPKKKVGVTADSFSTTGSAAATSVGAPGAPKTAEWIKNLIPASFKSSARSPKTGRASAARKSAREGPARKNKAQGAEPTTAASPLAKAGGSSAAIGNNSSAAVTGVPKAKEKAPASGVHAANASYAEDGTMAGAADYTGERASTTSTAADAAAVEGVSSATTNVVYIVPEQTPPAVRLVLGRRRGWTEWNPEVHGADEVSGLSMFLCLLIPTPYPPRRRRVRW